MTKPNTEQRTLNTLPPHPSALPVAELLAACSVRRTRGSGPGGQHRNKVETAIEIVHEPTGVQGEARERRSQEQNRQQAVQRLRVNLALAVRTPFVANQSSELWRSRLRAGRIEVNPDHEDFPALLAEALDAVAGCEWEVKDAATKLGCTSSQLVKLLKLEPAGLTLVNRQRQLLGLHAIR